MASNKNVEIAIDGIKTRQVESIMYDLHQQTDVEGQPSTIVRGGKIHVKVKSLDDGNTDILEWMTDAYGSKGGSITFPKRTTGTNMKTLKFTDGYCVDYQEVYDALDSDSQYEMFTISAKKIEIGGATMKNKWTEAT